MDSVAPSDRCVECSAGDPLRARTQSTPTTQLGHMERRNPEKAIYFIKKTKKTKCSHSKGFGASWTLGSSRAGRLRSLRRRPSWEILREIRVAEHEQVHVHESEIGDGYTYNTDTPTTLRLSPTNPIMSIQRLVLQLFFSSKKRVLSLVHQSTFFIFTLLAQHWYLASCTCIFSLVLVFKGLFV